MFRIIHFEFENLEFIYIVDCEDPAEDYVKPGGRLISDTTYDQDLPSGFPINSEFVKTF
jgi:hypothetical protein